ncbi:MAG TPA: BamA/TamA family outer membrane protein [Panacibacter sp.]|nr:BamA/TamA family outer membrane protein [Panacibacter sp.]HNP42670.1 BamA/TamA family outer membrane protein [Panacibacter sp.]
MAIYRRLLSILTLRFGGRFIATVVLLVALQSATPAQTAADSLPLCPVKSVGDLFKKKDSLLVVKPVKNNFLIVIPVIGSQPATGFIFGVTSQYTFKDKAPNSKFSTVAVSANYTTKKQVLLNLKNNMLLNHNRIFLSGDWRYYIFTQPNYGLGTDIIPPKSERPDDFNLDSLAQPMDYNYFKLHQTVSWKVNGNFYVGAGLHLDSYSKIVDKTLDTANSLFTHHYNYSTKYGFNSTDYTVNGVSLNLLYDSRDNQVNANHGWYGNINFRVNPALSKHQRPSTVLYAEYRKFWPLSKTNEQHVFAIWAYGQFATSGKLPYLNLPALGWDQRSRAGKGYQQGLFRGNNLMYFEAEYRFPITCNQLISGTVFGDLTTASDKDRDIYLLKFIQPAIGVSLRILIDKATRTNLIFNQAWGRKSKGFYLNAAESF